MNTKLFYISPEAEILWVSIEPIALSLNQTERTEIISDDDEIDL